MLEERSPQQADLPVSDYLLLVYRVSFGFVALAAVIYQGGMTIYYLRRRAAVRQFLEIPPGE